MSRSHAAASVILFVDDEVNILNTLKRELRDWSRRQSLELLLASSAKDGLIILEDRAAEIAVVVSDLKMPEMKGSDFLLIVKNKWPSIMTLLLTGFSETPEVMKAIKAGIFSYILKPWEPDYLQSELEKAVDMQRTRAQNSEYAKIMEDELKWAGEMQRAILKPNALRSEGVEFRTSYRPVPGLYCGGDYYDVINIGMDRYLMLTGDVSGHGVKAAFVTGILKAVIFPEYVRNTLGKIFSPADFLNWLNERMNFELRQTSNLIISFFAGVLDRAAMTFTYANAGQDHPFIVSGGVPRELPVSGSALGFAHSVMHAENTEFLNKGDVILIFTDGLVEPDAKQGRKAIVAMKEVLEQTAYGPDYHKRIMEAALVKSGSDHFEDDVTVVTATLV